MVVVSVSCPYLSSQPFLVSPDARVTSSQLFPEPPNPVALSWIPPPSHPIACSALRPRLLTLRASPSNQATVEVQVVQERRFHHRSHHPQNDLFHLRPQIRPPLQVEALVAGFCWAGTLVQRLTRSTISKSSLNVSTSILCLGTTSINSLCRITSIELQVFIEYDGPGHFIPWLSPFGSCPLLAYEQWRRFFVRL